MIQILSFIVPCSAPFKGCVNKSEYYLLSFYICTFKTEKHVLVWDIYWKLPTLQLTASRKLSGHLPLGFYGEMKRYRVDKLKKISCCSSDVALF